MATMDLEIENPFSSDKPYINYQLTDKDEEKEEDEATKQFGLSPNMPNVIDSLPPSVLQEVTTFHGGVDDDEFYDKLMALKNHHKRTLEVCEQLYHHKIALKNFKGEPGYTDLGLTLEPQLREKSDDILASNFGEAKMGDTTGLRKSQTKDASTDEWPRVPRSIYYKDFAVVPSVEDYIKTTQGVVVRETRDSALRKMSDMWKNFQVSQKKEKAEKLAKQRPRSASLSRLSKPKHQKEEENKQQKKEWKHGITIPEPFQMTIREANKPLRKSIAAEEMARARQEKELQDQAECQKQFRARPVPAHVYMPLYDEIQESQEARRRYNFEQYKVMLQSVERPFNFYKREQEKQKEKSITSKKSLKHQDGKGKTTFKANPYPSHLFKEDPDHDEVDDEIRKIRIKLRAEKLLQEAKLPPTMQERGLHYKKNKPRPQSAVLHNEKLHVPKVNAHVPDFEDLHRQFTKEMSKRKTQQEGTVCRPFNFASNKLVTQKKQKLHEQMEEGRSSNMNNNRTSQRPKTNLSRQLSSSMDALPSRLTTATVLRNSTTKQRLEQKAEEERAFYERERRQRMREEQLQQTIKEKALGNDRSSQLKKQRTQKLQEYKESERARQIEYHRQLNEMRDKLEKRPFLFEQSAEENAKKSANKRYEDVLHRAGVARPQSSGSPR